MLACHLMGRMMGQGGVRGAAMRSRDQQSLIQGGQAAMVSGLHLEQGRLWEVQPAAGCNWVGTLARASGCRQSQAGGW